MMRIRTGNRRRAKVMHVKVAEESYAKWLRASKRVTRAALSGAKPSYSGLASSYFLLKRKKFQF